MWKVLAHLIFGCPFSVDAVIFSGSPTAAFVSGSFSFSHGASVSFFFRPLCRTDIKSVVLASQVMCSIFRLRRDNDEQLISILDTFHCFSLLRVNITLSIIQQ